jgi:hypothetical protein
MALLVLIALAQLVVSVLVLGLLSELADNQASPQVVAEQTIARLQQQTIQSMFAAEAAAGSRGADAKPGVPRS